MFRAKFRRYWCDFASEYVNIRTYSIEEILEYAYKVHKNSVYPAYSSFVCCGGRQGSCGCLEARCSIQERWGYRGSLWLEQITYCDGLGGGEVIIFSKHDRYISPKASKAFDDFAAVAKQREEHKNFGDF